MQLLVDYQWEIFILCEVLSLVALLIFGLLRYYYGKKQLNNLFILLFLLLLILEAILGVLIYRVTGEFSTFQIIIIIFVLYACTFGIFDFIKLDRWMRRKIGNWRGIDLLTETDHQAIAKQKDPKHIAKVNRISAMIHLIVFVTVQAIFWSYGTENFEEALGYLTDLSWIETGDYKDSPYPNETLFSIGMIWMIVFVIDFIYSWSYTFFPAKK